VIVDCLSFGSLWWLRPGETADSSLKFSGHAAIFNTTGFRQGAGERRSWTIPGVLRFNAGTLADQRLRPEMLIGGKFQATNVEHRGSWNRLLLLRKVRRQVPPDAMLVNVRSVTVGSIAFGANWRSSGVRVIASSSFGGEQETLLLMAAGGEFTTSKGTWRCQCINSTMNCAAV
jgi:hypothetical protein